MQVANFRRCVQSRGHKWDMQCVRSVWIVPDKLGAVGIYRLVEKAVAERNVMKIQLEENGFKELSEIISKGCIEIKMSSLSKFESDSSSFQFMFNALISDRLPSVNRCIIFHLYFPCPPIIVILFRIHILHLFS